MTRLEIPLLLGTLILFPLLVGCTPSKMLDGWMHTSFEASPSENGTSQVQGKVTDNTGEPLVGAIVTLCPTDRSPSLMAATDVEGKFTIRLPQPAGAYQVRVEASGSYALLPQTLEVVAPGKVTLQIRLKTSDDLLGPYEPPLGPDLLNPGATVEVNPVSGEPEVHPH